MIRLSPILSVTVSLLLTTGCGTGSSEGSHADAIDRSSEYIEAVRARFQIPGIAVAVAINDSIIWSQGFGHANLEREVPVTRETLFRIGSVSKVLTAGALALLHEQGKLDLDAPVQRYVPEFPKKRYPITTRQLAGHLAGIRGYRIDEREDKRHYKDVIAALELFSSDSLEHPPGERYLYSSYGWNLVSAVLQRAAGQPFLEYMRAGVFQPLGMDHTVPDDVTRELPNRTTFYAGPEEVAPSIDISYKWASGGFLSTAEDLVRYGMVFLPGNPFLKPETQELLFTNQRTNDGREIIHGVGWVVQRLEDGRPLYYHPGSMVGCQAVLVVQPVDRIVVAILANRSGGFGTLVANQIACFFLGVDEENCPDMEGEHRLRIEKHERVQILSSAIGEWKLALESGNLDRLMGTYSEHFRSRQWNDKQTMRKEFHTALAAGAITVDDENLHLRFQTRGYPMGALTHVEGIRTTGSFGPFTIRLTFTREESGPLITDMDLLQSEN